jgi:hypothetical protein
MQSINKTIQIMTDTATLAIFDYAQLQSYLNDECDWWAQDFSDIAEVKTGKVAFIGLGADGVYDVRDDVPDQHEQAECNAGPIGDHV